MAQLEYRKFALVRWINDPGEPFGIINLKADTVTPEKPINLYEDGEEISAKCRGFKGLHTCRIEATSADRSTLSAVIAGRRNLPESGELSPSPTDDLPVNDSSSIDVPELVQYFQKKRVTKHQGPVNPSRCASPQRVSSIRSSPRKAATPALGRNWLLEASPSHSASPQGKAPRSSSSPRKAVTHTPSHNQSLETPPSRHTSPRREAPGSSCIRSSPRKAATPARSRNRLFETLLSRSPSPPRNATSRYSHSPSPQRNTIPRCNRSSPRKAAPSARSHSQSPQKAAPRCSRSPPQHGTASPSAHRRLELGSPSPTITKKKHRSPFAAGKDINVAQLAKNLYELQGQFAESQESIRKLKRRVRELEKNREGRVAVCEPRYNGNTMEELRATVVLETSTFKAARRLLTQLFSKDDLLSHSVSGKAPNRMTPPKPRFPEDKFLVYKDLMRGRFPEMKDKDMVEKVHHVQKGLKKV